LRLLVIGGSDAGISAGLRARELDPSVEVRLLVADAYPNFSICGLPYYLSGDVPDWRDLAHRTGADLQGAGLQLLLDHTAHAIDPAAKQATATDPAAAERQLGYDRFVIATGATAVGGTASFAGSLGTQVVKVFDLAVARTGLRDHEPRRPA
jgi:NADPH-dependent 2,4-dienoyl-CoA reductase/sulfur reductase-like enzyme